MVWSRILQVLVACAVAGAAGALVAIALAPGHLGIIAYLFVVLCLALYGPYVFDATPEKNAVDLVYYSAASIVAVAVYISTDFDREASTVQRQVARLVTDSSVFASNAADMAFVGGNRTTILTRIEDLMIAKRRVLAGLKMESCTEPAIKLDPGSDTYDFDKIEEADRRRQCLINTTVLALLEQASVAEIPSAARLRKSAEALRTWNVLYEPWTFRDGGSPYELLDVLDLVEAPDARIAELKSDAEAKIAANDRLLDTLQEAQRQAAAEEASDEEVLTSEFMQTIWPYILILLLGAKISRYPYLRTARDWLEKQAGDKAA